MKTILFRPVGWIYYPASVAGYLVTVLLAAIFVHDFRFIDSRSHSISDTYYNFVPYGFIYIATYLWIGSKSSPKSENI